MRVSEYAAKLKQEANFDSLSQLLNRRAFSLIGQALFSASQRYKHSLSVVLLDIDDFKKVNHVHGQSVGDEVIKMVAQTLRDCVRRCDYVARFGGEEFLLIYPETDLDVTFTLAESIRRDIEALKVPPIERITASIGVSVYRGNENINTIDLLLKQADKALYQAKEHGRNQVCSRDGEDEGQHV